MTKWLTRSFLFVSFLLFTISYGPAKEIEVTGKGISPSRARSPSQARLMAERAAKLDGYRRIIDRLCSEGYPLKRTEEGILIKGAKVIQTRYLESGTVEVVMTYNIED